MRDALYHFVVGVLDLFLWSGELIGEENLPQKGPAVFIANHIDATGPIGTACSIPLHLHTWVIGDMMDKDLAPVWLQADFTERQLHLKPPLSRWVARALCRLAIPLFYSFGCIPVYRGDYERMQETLQMSMDVLRKGEFLLIFPEDNRMPTDPLTRMQPFQRTFVRLGEMYHATTGNRLPFYPVAVHPKGVVQVGTPVVYNPLNSVGVERHRMKDMMEDIVQGMYLRLDGQNGEVGALTPQRK
jgi:1-acyl-sn-glycerol-3-phosphate acyltransferase